jgi:hypothetical protein
MLLGLAAWSLGGCSFSPGPVIQYRATSEGSTWDHGLELHSAKTERLDLRAGFLEYRTESVLDNSGPHPLYFRIEAANRSDTAVLVELSTAAASNIASLGIDVLSLFAKQTKEEKEDWGKSKEQSRQNQEYDERRHRVAADRLSRREAFWSDSSLRKTTVPPEGRLAGRIGFGIASYGPTPDTLRIQYREHPGGFTDLIAFGIVRDSAETARSLEAKKVAEAGKASRNDSPTGIALEHRPLLDGPANNPGRGQ